MSGKLLTDHHSEFLSLKGDCTGSSESTLVKMPHCWKSHVTAYCVLAFAWLSVFCFFSLGCCGLVCDCGISWSYSAAFNMVNVKLNVISTTSG